MRTEIRKNGVAEVGHDPEAFSTRLVTPRSCRICTKDGSRSSCSAKLCVANAITSPSRNPEESSTAPTAPMYWECGGTIGLDPTMSPTAVTRPDNQ